MKRILYYIIFICAAGIFTGCADNKNLPANQLESEKSGNAQTVAEGFIEQPLHTMRIQAITESDSGYQFSVKVQTPDPCWTYHRHEIVKEGDKVLLTVIGKREKAANCIQMIGSLEVEIPLSLSGPGEYTCQFWCYDNATLDTVITAH